ncbi:MAG: LLM class flavin-dependent oxidoreductase [Rhizomicrobium sp.]
MEFGLQFFPNVTPEEIGPAQYFDNCIALSREAETLGFTHTRMVEHYFHRYGGYSPNPLMFLSSLAQHTKTMRLVTGAILPVFSNPLKMAAEIAMADALSHGRLDVGFARAFLPHEFRRFGISQDESVGRFREGLEQIELLLTQKNVTHEGQFHRIVDTTSYPPVAQRPKFYIAATQTPESFEFAGRKGYCLMAMPMGQGIRKLFDIYRAAWREAGHPGKGEIMVAFHMFCDEDSARAREIARGPFDAYFRTIVEVTSDFATTPDSSNYRGYKESMSKMDTITLEKNIAAATAWIGTPGEVKLLIERMIEETGGFEHASMQVQFSNMELSVAQKSMRMFARDVLPAFAER